MRPRKRIGGYLAVYVAVLIILIVHGLGLSVAAIIVNANPSLGGLSEAVPWTHIVYYVVSNVALAAYTVLILRLIVQRRVAAIHHNAIWAVLTVAALVSWYALGMKFAIGVVIDSAPGIVGAIYLAKSTRVSRTLTE